MHASVGKYLLLSLVLGCVLFAGLGKPHLWDRDEPRNAGCAREMLQRGDWIVPTFNGELRAHKPILLYWFMLIAYQLGGVSEFTARLPSALLASGAVLLTWATGCRLLGQVAGLWSACILATFIMFGVIGRAATPDAALLFFTTAAVTLFVHAAWQPGATATAAGLLRPAVTAHFPFPSSRTTGMAIYALMGVAVLAKGPVGAILPMAIIGLFCLIVRMPAGPAGEEVPAAAERGFSRYWSVRWTGAVMMAMRPLTPRHLWATCLSLRPGLAAMAIGLVAAPWYLAVGHRTEGAWLNEFFGQHNLGRALQPMEGHSGSLLYYPLVLLICCYPWSVFTAPTVSACRKSLTTSAAARPAMIFLLCWLGVTVGLFSLAQTKLPSYVAPAYPAAAMLLGCFIAQVASDASGSQRVWLQIGMLTIACVGVLGSLGLWLAARQFLSGEMDLAWIGLIPAASGLVGWWLVRRGQTAWALRTTLAASVLFSWALFGILAARVSDHQQSPQLLVQLAGQPAGHLAAYGRLEPSWVYYAQQPIRFFPPGEGQALADFLASRDASFLMVPARSYDELKPQLPFNLQVVGRIPYFLRKDELLLMARLRPPETRSVPPSAARLPTHSAEVH